MHPAQYEALRGAAGIPPITGTIPEALRISGLSRSGLYRVLATGEIRAVKVGKKTLIVMESVYDYLNKLPAAQFRAPSKAA